MKNISSVSSLEYLYEAVLKDFFLIIVKIMKRKDESKEGKEKKEEKVPKKDKTSIEELFKDCNDFFNYPSISKAAQAYYPEIYALSKKYLNDIDELLVGKIKIKNFPVAKVEEHDIYLAYGILCCFGIIFEGVDLQKVSNFNYNEYPNFKEFIELYGNSKNLSNNYDTNFKSHQKDKKIIDLRLINNWIKKLDEKQLSPMKKKNKKKHKKNKDKKDKSINIDKKPFDDGQEKSTSDIQNKAVDNKNPHVEEKNEENSSIEKKEEKSEIKESNIDAENTNIISTNIGKSDNANNITSIKGEISDIPNKIKEENNSPLIKINDKNAIINEENILISKDEKLKDNISNISTIPKEIEENKDYSANQRTENNEIDVIKANSNSSINIQSIKRMEEKKEDDNSIEALRKEMKELKDKMGEKIDDLEKRVGKLEINQLLLYHQISMYQTSRDIYKSIYTYYFQYLDLKKLCPNPFEKLKAVIDYTKEEDTDKLKEMQYDATKTIPDGIKIKLLNYFKLHFFLNKVSNKIVHRNFSEEKKRILKEQNNDDNLMSLIPGFDFDQCFDILELFIENNAKNDQIKKAMEIVYDEKYINDENLGSIKDINGEVIKKDENGIHILYKKEDLKAVRNYFQNLNINDESFVKLCNDKIWDKEEF